MFKNYWCGLLALIRRAFFYNRGVFFALGLLALNLYSGVVDSFLVFVKPKDIWQPAPITNLVAQQTETSLLLSWTAPTENLGLQNLSAVSGYYIAYSTTPLTDYNNWWMNSSKITLNYASEPGQKEVFVFPENLLKNNKTYYIIVRSFDDASPPNISSFSNVVSITIRFKDDTIPKGVAGLNATFVGSERKLKITWSKVDRNTDGSLCDDLLEYRIYRSNSLVKGYKLVATVLADNKENLEWEETDNIGGDIYYYYITAVDFSGNESDIYFILRVAEDIKLIVPEPKDYMTHVILPYDQNQLLLKEKNSYGDNLIINVSKEEPSDEKVLKVYSLITNRYSDDKPVKDFVFSKPVKIIFYVGDKQGVSVKDLSIYWFNGKEWLKLGGEIDPYFNAISISTVRLGKYMVKFTQRASSFEIIGTQPEKIFTPNNDGWNDFFEIRYDNPKEATVVGKIYDVKGRFIADMKKGFSENTLIWDGNDYKGEPVNSGIYIYQLEVSGPERKILNGTCVVAR